MIRETTKGFENMAAAIKAKDVDALVDENRKL
jgi:hypothetical protein